MTATEQLDRFFEQHPRIRYVTPTSPDYAELRASWYPAEGATPLGIARPQSAEDVAAIVSFAVSHHIAFAVRCGGHDAWGRGFMANALTIDMRDIAFVNIDASKKCASIGGGTLIGCLAKELAKEKLATSTGSLPSIGYVGWAAYGGYGCFSGTYGLGMDQILAVRLVNCHGEIVDASPEMLRVIRGGGGTLGVIVEVTVKVYPLEKILSGFIAFESSDLAATIKAYAAGYRSLQADGFPAPLHLLAVVTNTPFGKLFGVSLIWSSSDFTTGYKYVERVASFGQAVMNTVAKTTIPEWQEQTEARVPNRMFGETNQKSCRVYELTDEVVGVMSVAAEKMPSDPSILMGMHTLRIAEEPVQETVFGVRTPHFLLEILPCPSEPDAGKIEEARKWALEYLNGLKKINPDNLELAQYISHTSPEDANYPAMYGNHWGELVAAKRKYDPENIFRSYVQFNELTSMPRTSRA